MERRVELRADVSREGMPNHPSPDAGARNREVMSNSLQPTPTLDFPPTAMGATGGRFLFSLYAAVYTPDSLRRECLLPTTKKLAGSQVHSLALLVPLCGVFDLLILR